MMSKKKILVLFLGISLLLSFTPVNATKNQGYRFPVDTYTRISQYFSSGSHNGIDIAANTETPVYATKSGTIIKKYTGCNNFSRGNGVCKSGGVCSPNHGFSTASGSSGYCNDGFGNGYIIKHDDGTWSEYAHMNYLSDSLYEGGYVTQGTYLGGVSSTGLSTGPHLHFGIRTGNVSSFWSATPLNPFDYMDDDDKGETTPSQINWPDVVAGTANTDTIISWSAATNATDYDVYIYKQGDSSYYHFGNTTSISYSVVLPAGTYEVEVVACNKSNGSNLYAGNAHRTTFTVTAAVPSQINWPDVVAGTSETNTVISWSAATNATDYDVYVYVRGSASYYHFGNTTSTNYSIVLPAGTYEVEVVACNKSNGSNVYAGNAHRTTFTVTEAATSPTTTPVPTSTPKPTEKPDTPVADGAVVKVSSVTASAGNTVNVTVDLSGNTGFANLGIQVGYDANNLTLTSVTNNSSVGATYTPAQSLTANPYNMGWDSTSNVTYNGNLATLTFRVKDNATEGKYPITVSYYTGIGGGYTDGEDVNYDADFNSLGLSYVNGAITVSSHIAGDINGDGKVNNQDGTFLLRHLAGWNVNVDESALDVNGDGKVNNQDGTVLLRYLAGWSVTIH